MHNFIYDLINYSLLAQGANDLPPQPGIGEVLAKMAPMFLIVMMIFYFMVIKPQQDKLRVQNAMLQGLKKGDQVVTSGGIIGKVSSLEEDCVVIEVSNSVRLRIERVHVVKVREQKGTETDKAA